MSDEQTGGHAASAETLNNNHASAVSDSALGSDVQAKIGQHLRAMYDDVVRQGVPDRFMDLLSQLDKAEDDSSNSGGGRR